MFNASCVLGGQVEVTIAKFYGHNQDLINCYGISVSQITTDMFNFFCKNNPVISSYMTDHRVCNRHNTPGVTNGAILAYPTGTSEFICGDRVSQSLVFCVVFCRSDNMSNTTGATSREDTAYPFGGLVFVPWSLARLMLLIWFNYTY
jgi:hypothetical protein